MEFLRSAFTPVTLAGGLAINACAGSSGGQDDREAAYRKARYEAALAIVRQVDADLIKEIPDSLRRYAAVSRQPLPAEGARVVEIISYGRSNSGVMRVISGQRDGWLGVDKLPRSAGETTSSSESSKRWQLDGGLIELFARADQSYPSSTDIVAFSADGAMFPLEVGKRWGYTLRQRWALADPDATANITKIELTDRRLDCAAERAGTLPGLADDWRVQCSERSAPAYGGLGNSLTGRDVKTTSRSFPYSPRLGLLIREPVGTTG